MTSVLFLAATERSPSVLKTNGLLRAARAYGWQVQTILPPADSDCALRKILDFWRPDGVIMDCGVRRAPPSRSVFGDVPVVFLGIDRSAGRNLFTACEDAQATARMAARELLRLDCALYAFVPPDTPFRWSELRAQHFRAAIRLNGKPYGEFVPPRFRDAARRTRSLRAWLARLPRPCGILAADDRTATEVLGACATLRLRVPDDIAVLGVGNADPICESLRPTLSSIAQDFERSGFLAARLLAARLHSPGMKPTSRTFPPLMVVRRASTRARTSRDGEIAKAVALIRARACEGLRAADVIRALNGSRRLVEMRFRKAVGHSILDEIQSVRMERAQELLLDPRRTLVAVANMCGYASEAAFRKVYRAAFGKSPRGGSRR